LRGSDVLAGDVRCAAVSDTKATVTIVRGGPDQIRRAVERAPAQSVAGTHHELKIFKKIWEAPKNGTGRL